MNKIFTGAAAMPFAVNMILAKKVWKLRRNYEASIEKIKRWLAGRLKDELLETVTLTFVPACRVKIVECREDTKVITNAHGCVVTVFRGGLSGYTIELDGYKVVKK